MEDASRPHPRTDPDKAETAELRRRFDILARQFDFAQHLAQVGSWEVDLAAGTAWWSDECYRIHGFGPGEIEATFESYLASIHPEDRTRVLEARQATLDSGAPFAVEHRIVRPDGSIREVVERGELFPASDARGALFAGVIMDVTEQKQAAAKQIESEQRYRMFFEHSPDLIFVHRHGRIEYINRVGVEMLGASSPDQIVGQSPLQFVHPDDHAVVTERIARLLKEPTVAPTAELRAIALDGTERLLETRASSFSSEGGLAIQVACRDITERRKAEAQMRLLEACVAHMNDIVLVTEAGPLEEPGPPITFVNQAFTRITGYRPEEVLGRSPRILQGQDTQRAELDRIRTALERREAVTAELINYSRSGRPYWLEIDIVPLRDSAGEISRFLAVQRDVTERKHQQEALIAKEASIRALMDNLPGIVFLFRQDQQMRRWNHEAERALGFSMKDFEHMRALEFVAPRDRARGAALIEQAFAGGQLETTLHLRTKDGAEPAFLLRVCRVEEGGEPCLLGVALDVSKQRKAEARMRSQALLLDQTRDAIFVVESQTRITYWNHGAEELYGWSKAEANELPVDALFQQPDGLHEVLATVDARGEWQGDHVHRARDGSVLHVEGRWTRLEDADGEAPGRILVVNTDLTERRRLEAQFRRAQRMEAIGTLAGGLAHDLNNILAPILLSIGMLRRRVREPQESQTLDTMEASIRRGAEVIGQVLSFARGVGGNPVALAPALVLREVVALVQETLPRSIECRVEIARELSTILADVTQLHQALLNLCVNARDAMPNGGLLTLSARDVLLGPGDLAPGEGTGPGTYVMLSVADTGTGIPEEIRGKIFEAFFTTKKEGEGTGFGLSTVRDIVRRHRGFIRLTSHYGSGSRFDLYFPATPPGPSTEDDRPSTLEPSRGTGETILFVDDEASVREMAAQILNDRGYHLLLAENGARALSTFYSHRDSIALVVTDMRMPVMDGPSLIRALRRVAPQLPVIATTGFELPADSLPSISCKLIKPYTEIDLLRALHAALAESRPPPPDPPAIGPGSS